MKKRTVIGIIAALVAAMFLLAACESGPGGAGKRRHTPRNHITLFNG